LISKRRLPGAVLRAPSLQILREPHGSSSQLAGTDLEAIVIAPSPTRDVPRLLMLTLALALGCASSKKEQQSAPLPSYRDSRTVTAMAVVQAIDPQTRKVTLKGEDGKPFSFTASKEVRNLPQVQVGDTVKVTYTESLAIEVKREEGGTPTVSESAGVTRAEPGQKPGGTASSTVTVSAVITDIDRASSHVTLKGPEGNYRVVEVKDPKNLENVQVGDMVHATYTESIGLAVEKVPAPNK
jgi:Cu/Ag efflux protein CusF